MNTNEQKNIIFHSNHQTGDCNQNCTEIKRTNTAKYLGYHIDKNWKSETHINKLIGKLRSIMLKLYQLRHVLNFQNKNPL